MRAGLKLGKILLDQRTSVGLGLLQARWKGYKYSGLDHVAEVCGVVSVKG